MKIAATIREIVSEPTGTLSWGRITSTAAFFVVVSWVTYLVFKNHAMPDLSGATGFVVGPYSANKLATMVQSFSQNPVVPSTTKAGSQ